MNENIRVLIVDDHAVVREGLRALIRYEPGLQLVGEAQDGIEAMVKARQEQPDVVLLDLVMSRQDGLETIRLMQDELPQIRILVLTSFAEDDKVFSAIKSGALGYLLKDSSPDDLLRAIRDVFHDQSSLHPAIARKLVREISRQSKKPLAEQPLTTQEMEVLKLLAKGMGNQEIGDQMGISILQVRSDVNQILTKLHLANRTQAALYALREGITELDPAPAGVQEGQPLKLASVQKPVPVQPLVEPLSERELEVLQLLAQGFSNREIGAQLFLAVPTVKGHNRHIYAKLQVRNRTEAVTRARELGLL